MFTAKVASTANFWSIVASWSEFVLNWFFFGIAHSSEFWWVRSGWFTGSQCLEGGGSDFLWNSWGNVCCLKKLCGHHPWDSWADYSLEMRCAVRLAKIRDYYHLDYLESCCAVRLVKLLWHFDDLDYSMGGGDGMFDCCLKPLVLNGDDLVVQIFAVQ